MSIWPTYSLIEQLSRQKNIPTLKKNYTVETGEALSACDVVQLLNNNKVQKFRKNFTIGDVLDVHTETTSFCVVRLTTNKLLVVYVSGTSSILGTVLTISGTSISKTSPVTLVSGQYFNLLVNVSLSVLSEAKIVLTYSRYVISTEAYGNSVVITRDAGTDALSAGTVVEWDATSNANVRYVSSDVLDAANEKVIVQYANLYSNKWYAFVITVTGTTINYGSIALIRDFVTNAPGLGNVVVDTTSKAISFYTNSVAAVSYAKTLSISGTTITPSGTENTISSSNSQSHAIKVSSSKFIYFGSHSYDLYSRILDISGDTVTTLKSASISESEYSDVEYIGFVKLGDSYPRLFYTDRCLSSLKAGSINYYLDEAVIEVETNAQSVDASTGGSSYPRSRAAYADTGKAVVVYTNASATKIQARVVQVPKLGRAIGIYDGTNVVMKGIADCYTNLVPGKAYYYNNNGSIQLEVVTGQGIGDALSDTELLIKPSLLETF